MDQEQVQQQMELKIDLAINDTSVWKQSKSSLLSRFHAGYFRITLSLSAQALLWKTLSEPSNDTHTLGRLLRTFPPSAFLLLWSIALFTLISLSIFYVLRCIFLFHMVKSEFNHNVGVNYLFAPWISWLLLLQSSLIFRTEGNYYLVLWWVFTIPIILLDVKIYGQWFTKGKRLSSTAANPTSQLSAVGNLVGAWAAAQMGWREMAICMFSLGIIHYLVLFVTLYQRFPGGNSIPVLLRPVFFLFIATPSMASLAWYSISGTFDTPSKMLFFLSLFLFASLVCRPCLFKKSMRKFNIAWWAYSFPVTILALNSAAYAQEVKSGMANALMLVLLVLSVSVSLGLMVFTLFNTNALLPENDCILFTPNNNSSKCSTSVAAKTIT